VFIYPTASSNASQIYSRYEYVGVSLRPPSRKMASFNLVVIFVEAFGDHEPFYAAFVILESETDYRRLLAAF
jgi:hypothetical protein